MCSQFGGWVPRERSAHACSGDRGRKSVSQIDAVLPHYLALRLMQFCFYCILFFEAVMSLPRFKERGNGCYLLMRRGKILKEEHMTPEIL